MSEDTGHQPILAPPPDRPGLGSTFKRPLTELIVGDPNSGFIDIEGKIPPELIAYYALHWSAVLFRASIRFVIVNGANDSYFYMVAGSNVPQTFDLFATGWVDPTNTVHESSIVQLIPGTNTINDIFGNFDTSNMIFGQAGAILMNNDSRIAVFDAGGINRYRLQGTDLIAFAGAIIQILTGATMLIATGASIEVNAGGAINVNIGGDINLINGGNIDAGNGSFIIMNSGSSIVVNSGAAIAVQNGSNINYALGAGMNYNSIPMGRGLAYGLQLAGNPIVTSVAGAEIAVSSLGVFTYRAGRAYQWTFHAPVSATAVPQQARVRLRQGVGIAGTQIAQWTKQIPVVTVTEEMVMTVTVLNATAVDITENVTVTLQGVIAGNNVAIFGNGVGQGQILCTDIGAASFFPGTTANW